MNVPVFLLAVLDKGQRVDLSKAERSGLTEVLSMIADDYRAGVARCVIEMRGEGMTTFGHDRIASAKEARAIARGEFEPGRAFTPLDIDAAAIRKRSGLSQERFAKSFGFSAGAVRDWEQGRRRPDPAARTLLLIIDREPEAVDRALRAA